MKDSVNNRIQHPAAFRWSWRRVINITAHLHRLDLLRSQRREISFGIAPPIGACLWISLNPTLPKINHLPSLSNHAHTWDNLIAYFKGIRLGSTLAAAAVFRELPFTRPSLDKL